ncbi:hypothetical protein EMPG_13583 [Blastomyces silverae]|uniref:Uncharacterized protein n=1 Tax=Blastomyces silverae TaxID=2060906 RepID=A0A0H1BJB9_9EURO|nr:hypothetical protein EMPG_13583 [Blastomyces silverae]
MPCICRIEMNLSSIGSALASPNRSHQACCPHSSIPHFYHSPTEVHHIVSSPDFGGKERSLRQHASRVY